MKDERYYLRLLDLSYLTTLKALKKAFRVKASLYHPDNIRTGNKEKFIEIQEAYEELKKKLVEKIVIFVSIEDILSGCSYKYKDFTINIDVNNFFKLIKSKKYKIDGVNYKFVLKIKESKDYKIRNDNGHFLFLKNVILSLDEFIKKYYTIKYGKNEYTFYIPNNGLLQDIKRINEKLSFGVNYKIDRN